MIDSGDGQVGRVHLDRVLSGLRHLEASHEPARVFAGLAQVCVPDLCDECLVEVTEQGTRPYRIRRLRPGLAPALTSQEQTQPDHPPVATDSSAAEAPDPLGVSVTGDDFGIRAYFMNSPGSGPPYRGVLACRWERGYHPAPSDRALVGVLVDHAVALVHRERAALAGPVATPTGADLPMQHRIAAASGILMALYHLSPAQARQLLSRTSEQTSACIADIADTVLRTGALPPPAVGQADHDRTGLREPGPVDAP